MELNATFENTEQLHSSFGEVFANGSIPIASKDKLGGVKVGKNLSVTEDGTLSVLTTNDAEEDNTKPITSAGVYTQVGNIEVLLAAL